MNDFQDLAPNDDAAMARDLAMAGVPEEHIAVTLRMSVAELRRRHGRDMRDGKSAGVVTAMQILYTLAVGRKGDPEKCIREILPDEKCLRFYLQAVAGMNNKAGGATPKPPRQVGEEVSRQIIKTIVGTPQDVANFLRMRRDQQMAEDAEEGILIENGERVDF